MPATVFKVVQTESGPRVAHLRLPEGTNTFHRETASDSRFRAERLLPIFIEGCHTVGWGPVDGRTIYRIGEITVSDGYGLHAFRKRRDAEKWMEQADI